jgi:hypothetical protein
MSINDRSRAVKVRSMILAISAALSCAACGSQSQPLSTVQAPPQGSPNVISGPAPMPSSSSYRKSPNYTQQGDTSPDMPNDNPGSGLTLGRSRSF